MHLNKKLEKTSYKVYIYEVDNEDHVIKTTFSRTDRPHINDYVNYFAPKLSRCYSIQFAQLKNDNNHYKIYEQWIRTKLGWRKVI